MKLEIYIDKNNYLTNYAIIQNPEDFPKDFPMVDATFEETFKMQPGKTKYINGHFDFSEINTDMHKHCIRSYRKEEIFPIINRGQLWYDTLTNEQKEELRVWYQGWLDAPETLVVPNKPNWL